MFDNVSEMNYITAQLSQALGMLASPGWTGETNISISIKPSQGFQDPTGRGALIIIATPTVVMSQSLDNSVPKMKTYLSVGYSPFRNTLGPRQAPSVMINDQMANQGGSNGNGFNQFNAPLDFGQHQVPGGIYGNDRFNTNRYPLFNCDFDTQLGYVSLVETIVDEVMKALLTLQLDQQQPRAIHELLNIIPTGVSVQDEELIFTCSNDNKVVIHNSAYLAHPLAGQQILAKVTASVLIDHKENHQVPLQMFNGDRNPEMADQPQSVQV